METKFTITSIVTGDLAEIENATAPVPYTLPQVLDMLRKVTFIAESVAHLQGHERIILPVTDEANKILTAMALKAV